MEEHNGVTVRDVLEALDRDDAGEGRRLLRRMLSPEALPCPCCGSPPEFVEEGDNVMIVCTECGLRTPVGEYADVTAVWNTRPSHGEGDETDQTE